MSGGRNYSNMSSGRDYIRIEKAAKARRTTANAVTYFPVSYTHLTLPTIGG